MWQQNGTIDGGSLHVFWNTTFLLILLRHPVKFRLGKLIDSRSLPFFYGPTALYQSHHIWGSIFSTHRVRTELLVVRTLYWRWSIFFRGNFVSMDILRVLRERSTNAIVSTKAPAATQLIDQSGCSTQKPEESYEKTAVEAGADLFPRVVRLSCMLPDSSNERDVVITVLENPSGSWAAGNGSTLWDSSIALSGYLLKHQIPWLQGKRGLELGAGTRPMLQCSSFCHPSITDSIHSHILLLLFP